MSNHHNPGTTNTNSLKISLDDLQLEPPRPLGSTTVDFEYRAGDRHLQLDFCDRDGRAAVLVSFEIINDVLVAHIQYSGRAGKQDEMHPLIMLT